MTISSIRAWRSLITLITAGVAVIRSHRNGPSLIHHNSPSLIHSEYRQTSLRACVRCGFSGSCLYWVLCGVCVAVFTENQSKSCLLCALQHLPGLCFTSCAALKGLVSYMVLCAPLRWKPRACLKWYPIPLIMH